MLYKGLIDADDNVSDIPSCKYDRNDAHVLRKLVITFYVGNITKIWATLSELGIRVRDEDRGKG